MAPRSDGWSRIKEVFAAARALSADARPVYLTEACGGNDALRHEVESLLASDELAQSFLESPPRVAATEVTAGLEGRRIGAYQIGARIGSGGMGEVYQAHDTVLNRQVAIKVVRPTLAQDSESLSRLRREAQVLASLNHPHIAQIHGFQESDDVRALVMELVPGQTLAERIGCGAAVDSQPPAVGAPRNAPLPIREALGLAKQIAEALEAAHEQGIIHRDLKPANIKVREDATVKVLDFGLARALDAAVLHGADASRQPSSAAEATATGDIFGTPAYMSPEQARGKPVDRRADIWAFGCILFELLTGQRAFGGGSATEVLEAVQTIEPEWARLPAKTPAAIRTLLRRCLEKDRGRRLDSATAVRLEIEDALAAPVGDPAVAAAAVPGPVTESRPSRHDLPRRRQPHPLILAGAGALALVTLVAVWQLWQRDYFWRNPLTGAAVHRVTDFPGEEADAAISPDGKFLIFLSDRDGPFDAWLTQIGSGEFTNVTKGRFEMMNNPNTRMLGFSGDGSQIWFTQQVTPRPLRWTAWVGPLLGGSSRPLIEGGLEPIWSPDGKNVIYHTNDLGDPFFISDRNGSNPIKVFAAQPGVHAHYPTWSPDGRFVYFVRGILPTDELDIWRVAVSAGETAIPERITTHNARVGYPAWLDARTLIYSATAEDGSGQWLYAVDVERRIPHRVSSGVAEQYLSVAVSDTTPRHVVTTIAVPTAHLWRVPISESVQTEASATRLPVANTRALSPRFAPDYLAFLSSKGGANGLWKLEHGEVTELWRGENGGVVAPPAISRDGRLICFSYRREGRAGLYVMNANGTNVRTLLDGIDVRGSAAWSPDGKWVAVAGNRGEGTRLFKVPMDGGPPVRLADTLSYNPVWSPDGRLILYSEQQRAGQFEVKAITPDQVPVPIVQPQIVGLSTPTQYRFVPTEDALVVLGGVVGTSQNFFRVDLATGERRQLTDLNGASVIRNFDVSPDGTHIVFDRWLQHSDIALMTLAR